MQSIRVVVPDEVAAKLTELADAEYRAPRQQAAVLLIEAVERAGHGARAGRDEPEPVEAHA